MSKSYERLLLETVAQIILDSVEINDFATGTLGSVRKVQIGMDEDEPPSMENNSVIIIHSAIPRRSEIGSRTITTDLTITVGHQDVDYIDLGDSPTNVAKALEGKMNNSDFAELVSKTLCPKLQKLKIGACDSTIQELLDQYYPDFVHMISISITTPKNYRDSVHFQKIIKA